MLTRTYLFASLFLVTGYVAAEWFGWEFGNPIRMGRPPEPGAAVSGGSGWGGGRSSTYRSYPYSSGTRSGVGGGGLGGK